MKKSINGQTRQYFTGCAADLSVTCTALASDKPKQTRAIACVGGSLAKSGPSAILRLSVDRCRNQAIALTMPKPGHRRRSLVLWRCYANQGRGHGPSEFAGAAVYSLIPSAVAPQKTSTGRPSQPQRPAGVSMQNGLCFGKTHLPLLSQPDDLNPQR